MRHFYVLFIIVSCQLLLSFCTVQKRSYRKGWHVEWRSSIKSVQAKRTNPVFRSEPQIRQNELLVSRIQEDSSRLRFSDSSNAFTHPAIERPDPNQEEVSVKSSVLETFPDSLRKESSVQKKNSDKENHKRIDKWVILFVLVVILLIIVALISVSMTETLLDTIGVLLYLLLLLLLLTIVILFLGTREKRNREKINREQKKREKREQEIRMTDEEWNLKRAALFRKLMTATIVLTVFFVLIALLLLVAGMEPVFLGGLAVVFLLFFLLIWARYWRQKPQSGNAADATDRKKQEKIFAAVLFAVLFGLLIWQSVA